MCVFLEFGWNMLRHFNSASIQAACWFDNLDRSPCQVSCKGFDEAGFCVLENCQVPCMQVGWFSHVCFVLAGKFGLFMFRKGHFPRDKRIQMIYEMGGMTLPGSCWVQVVTCLYKTATKKCFFRFFLKSGLFVCCQLASPMKMMNLAVILMWIPRFRNQRMCLCSILFMWHVLLCVVVWSWHGILCRKFNWKQRMPLGLPFLGVVVLPLHCPLKTAWILVVDF